MGVENRHPQYDDNEYQWRQMRDTVNGSSAVKRSGELYLPIPAAMLQANAKRASISSDGGKTNSDQNLKSLISRAPWNHSNKFYSDYIQRARFPDITSLTLRALLGIATKKKPVVELPSSIEYLEESCTPDGWTIPELYMFLIAELLTVGRVELLVDVKSNNEIVFIPYVAESLTNWKEIVEDGEKVNITSVLNEQADEKDEFDHSLGGLSDDYIVLRIQKGEDGGIVYTTQKYIDGEPVGEPEAPSLQGTTLERIPLIVGNATKLGLNVGMSPMLGISDVAISIYQKDADMSQSEYMSCNPWLVFIGIDEDDAPKSVGSQLAFVIENQDGDAKYVEPAATSLDHMQARIDKLFEEGLKYGVALLSNGGNSAESTETLRMRQESQGATLKTIAINAANMINEALKIAIEWTGSTNSNFRFEPNLEFSEHKLTPAELKELLNALVENTISYETYFENLQKGGIISEEKETQDELDEIAGNPPRVENISDDQDSDLNLDIEEEQEESESE